MHIQVVMVKSNASSQLQLPWTELWSLLCLWPTYKFWLLPLQSISPASRTTLLNVYQVDWLLSSGFISQQIAQSLCNTKGIMSLMLWGWDYSPVPSHLLTPFLIHCPPLISEAQDKQGCHFPCLSGSFCVAGDLLPDWHCCHTYNSISPLLQSLPWLACLPKF